MGVNLAWTAVREVVDQVLADTVTDHIVAAFKTERRGQWPGK